MGVTVVVMVKCGDKNDEAKMKALGLHSLWLHKKAVTLSGVGTSTTSGKLKIPMAIQLQESDMVIPECVHSHEIPRGSTSIVIGSGMSRKVLE